MKKLMKSIYMCIAFTTMLVVFVSCGSFGEGMLMGLSQAANGYAYGMYGSAPAYSSMYSSSYVPDFSASAFAVASSSSSSSSSDATFQAGLNAIAQQVEADYKNQDYQNYLAVKKSYQSIGKDITYNDYLALMGQGLSNQSSSSSSSSSRSVSSSSSSSSSKSSSSSSRKCIKHSASDHAHCNGTGVCSRCNGKGRYYDTSFGNNKWVDCSTCGKTGKCPSCHGTGYL